MSALGSEVVLVDVFPTKLVNKCSIVNLFLGERDKQNDGLL